MSDAKKMEDTKFYTEMQLATKSLLRQANTKRIAQSHYTAPSFSDQVRPPPPARARRNETPPPAQLNMDLDDPGKKRKKKARRARKDGEAEEPRLSATASGNIGGSDRSSRLSGLLGLHRKKAKAQKEHIEMPPDVSEERFALMAASVPRGTAGGDHSRSLPLLGVPALEEHLHPESFALKPRVFGVPERAFADAAGPAKPAATERSVAHSVQRCVEQLVRHRDPKDYVYILEVTDFKATGCGDFVEGTGQEKVSRGPEPHVVCSALKAWNEHDYSLDKIKRRSKRAFDVEYAEVGQRRLRTQQRDAVKAQLAAIVHRSPIASVLTVN